MLICLQVPKQSVMKLGCVPSVAMLIKSGMSRLLSAMVWSVKGKNMLLRHKFLFLILPSDFYWA